MLKFLLISTFRTTTLRSEDIDGAQLNVPSPHLPPQHGSAGESRPMDTPITSMDDLKIDAKKRAINLGDLAEEKIRLMLDTKRLDEDILDALIRGLKIPAPSLTDPAAAKEILFPANLISLVTNEMWKYSLISESQQFLANVMQTIQEHVMVCTYLCWYTNILLSF